MSYKKRAEMSDEEREVVRAKARVAMKKYRDSKRDVVKRVLAAMKECECVAECERGRASDETV